MTGKIAMAALVAMALLSAGVHAHGDKPRVAHGDNTAAAEPTAYGRPGTRANVTRTLTIAMSDQMRYSPSSLIVKRGETIRIVVRNDGRLLHELVLGTREDLATHAALMRKFPDMEHEDANMVHVKPGATGDIVWTFDRAGEFFFACLVAGHFEAGMTGKVVVK